MRARRQYRTAGSDGYLNSVSRYQLTGEAMRTSRARTLASYVTLFTLLALLAVLLVLAMDRIIFFVVLISAHCGQSNAQVMIGRYYLQGYGTEKDTESAMEWFKLSAEQNNGYGAYHVAVGYFNGMVDDVSEEKAQSYLIMAADQGIEAAKKTLQELYPERF